MIDTGGDLHLESVSTGDTSAGTVNYYFELTDPPEIGYMYKIRQARDFGASLNETLLNVELIPSNPIHGCSKLENVRYVKKNIALVERGGCSFLSKTINAEMAGAVAVIIMDNDHSNYDRFIDMIQDETNRRTMLPAYFLLGKDGIIIRRTLEQKHLHGALINIPLNLSLVPLHKRRLPPWTIW
ncbi:DgyrCDS5456 [Dimorphilus gyrociliatus]|uniref:DgyrCDS5456 n=1 Tax=Dimorphilus gyrociliatus TaxID=2664684 RepID=A0A7I8VK29_9ANNE|nr:DgyrCDS5456 [Dimorphilus gyrociliatus]